MEKKPVRGLLAVESWRRAPGGGILEGGSSRRNPGGILDKASWPEARRPWFEMIDRVIIGKALGGRTDRDSILAAYRANIEAVHRLVDARQVLVFRASDGWAPLCDFLGVGRPQTPYPMTNARAEFFAAARSVGRSVAE